MAKEQERRSRAGLTSRSRTDKPVVPAGPVIRGVKILDFSPKSDARKAGLQKGDVIIEYNGNSDLTADKLLALTAQTRRERIHPVVVFVRDGYQYSTRVSRGFLGISVIDASLQGPFKRPAPRDRKDRDGTPKSGKALDWT